MRSRGKTVRRLLMTVVAALIAMTTTVTQASAADPYTASAKQDGVNFTTTFGGSPLNGNYLFDIELWNSSGQRVWQEWENRTVANAPSLAIQKSLPALPNGTYTVRAGIFSQDWSTKYLWTENAGNVTVGATYAMASNVSAGTIATKYTSSLNFNGSYLFDIELWNSSGQRVWQQWDTKNVSGTKSVSISKSVPALGNGTYTVRGGIFSNDWSTRYYWTDTSGSLTVNGGTVVTTTSSSTTTSTSTTSTTKATTTTTQPAPPPVNPTFTVASTQASTTFDTKFTSSQNYNGNYLFDVELWNSSGQRVYQQYETRNVVNTKVVTITKSIPSLSAGTYSVRGGVFSTDWSTKYVWTDSAGNLVVQGAPNNGGSGASAPTGPSGNWKMIFNDEFNGTSLDQNKWLTCSPQMKYQDGICMGHDGERQEYLPQNVSIVNFPEGGRGLQLTAQSTNKTWGNTRPNDVPYGAPVYDSGALSSGPNNHGLAQPGYQPFSFKYGYFESRMKLPKGQGFWPATWMFPTDNQGPWEIDQVEVLGSDPFTPDFSAHYPGGQTDEWGSTPDLSAGFHTFGVDWQPDHIAWYVDGKLARSVFTNTGGISPKAQYLIINLAVGGNWPGPPDGSTQFPGNMNVDWVRVWTRS